MRNAAVIACLLFAVQLVLAQPQPADTARQKELRMAAFGKAYSAPDSAFRMAREALALARQIDYDRGKANTANIIGILHDIQGEYDSSLYYYRKALYAARKFAFAGLEGKVLNNMGLIHWNRGELDSAVVAYSESAELFERTGSALGLGNSYNNMGLVYSDLALDEMSLKYHRKALAIFLELEDDKRIGATFNNIGLAYYEDSTKVDSGIWYFNAAVEYARKVDDKYGLSKALTNLGLQLDQNEQYPEAAVALTEALALKEEINDPYGYVSTAENLGVVLWGSLGQPRDAIPVFRKALSTAQAINYTKLYWKINWSLSGAFRDLQQYDSAYHYSHIAHRLHTEFWNEESRESLLELQTKYETARAEHRIELLSKDTAIKELELERQASKTVTIVVVLVSLLITVVAVGGFLWNRSRLRQEAAHQQAIISEQQQGLKAVIQAQEEERKRIAKDLHDGIGQQLSGLKLAWSGLTRDLDKPQLETRLSGLTKVLDDSCADVRNLSHQMMPRSLRESGAAPAINDMLNKSFGHSDMVYEFDTFGADGRYTEQVELTLYRVAQELVNNIIKHSGASRVSVQLLKNRNNLVLLVEDNGSGFDFEGQQASGMGLLNIGTRLKSVNGTIAYERGPEGGTVATVRIPITSQQQQSA